MREAFGLDEAAQAYLLARHRVAFGASELQKLCHEHAHLLVFMADVRKPGVIAHLALEKLGVCLHHRDGRLELMPRIRDEATLRFVGLLHGPYDASSKPTGHEEEQDEHGEPNDEAV